MKRIINNLLYDTEKSTFLFKDDCSRRFYKTKNGRYFWTRWYDYNCLNICQESDIRTILMEDPDLYQKIFGSVLDA